MKVTAIEFSALRHIERQDVFPGASYGHGNTMRSLEHKGLVQRGKRGDWFLTNDGISVLKERQ